MSLTIDQINALQAENARLRNELHIAATVCASVANPRDDQEWDWPGLASRFRAAALAEQGDADAT